MTNVRKLSEFSAEIRNLVESKENPDEWYVLVGDLCGTYDVYDDSVEEHSGGATEFVSGFMQAGTSAWASKAFKDDSNFVSEWNGYGDGKLDTCLMNILLVHEDMLTQEAIAAANSDFDGREEVPADD